MNWEEDDHSYFYWYLKESCRDGHKEDADKKYGEEHTSRNVYCHSVQETIDYSCCVNADDAHLVVPPKEERRDHKDQYAVPYCAYSKTHLCW